MDVFLEKVVGLQSLNDLVRHVCMPGFGEKLRSLRYLLAPGYSRLGQHDVPFLFIDFEIFALAQLRGDAVCRHIGFYGFLRGTRDDEGCACLVDEDRVNLVHDAVGVPPLHLMTRGGRHVVPKVVETEFAVCPVGNVRPVGLDTFFLRHKGIDDSHGKPQITVYPPHPLRIPTRQVVVDGDDMDALALQRVQDNGQRCDERLPLARLHFGNLSLVERHTPHKLHVEMAKPQLPLGNFPYDREDFLQDVVQGFPFAQPLPEPKRRS